VMKIETTFGDAHVVTKEELLAAPKHIAVMVVGTPSNGPGRFETKCGDCGELTWLTSGTASTLKTMAGTRPTKVLCAPCGDKLMKGDHKDAVAVAASEEDVRRVMSTLGDKVTTLLKCPTCGNEGRFPGIPEEGTCASCPICHRSALFLMGNFREINAQLKECLSPEALAELDEREARRTGKMGQPS
jgi:DNA-directed RNA polymerase subunit RPC12/RpoP